MDNAQDKFGTISHKVIGCAMKVHSTLKPGFQEVIYQRALEIEMQMAELNFLREFEMPIFYRNKIIGNRRVDFFVENEMMVELKAIAVLDDNHLAQAKNYLEAYNMKDGLLINFGSKSLEVKRLFNQHYNPHLNRASNN